MSSFSNLTLTLKSGYTVYMDHSVICMSCENNLHLLELLPVIKSELISLPIGSPLAPYSMKCVVWPCATVTVWAEHVYGMCCV